MVLRFRRGFVDLLSFFFPDLLLTPAVVVLLLVRAFLGGLALRLRVFRLTTPALAPILYSSCCLALSTALRILSSWEVRVMRLLLRRTLLHLLLEVRAL